MSKKRNREARRDISTIANDPLPRLLEPVRPVRPVVITRPPDLRTLEDRRLFHPDPITPIMDLRQRMPIVAAPKVARSTKGRIGPKKNQSSKYSYTAPQAVFNRRAVLFQEPKKVVICVRRSMRTEVLHATGKAGKGGQRKPRYNAHSNIRCK